jgi:hypothetical protein
VCVKTEDQKSKEQFQEAQAKIAILSTKIIALQTTEQESKNALQLVKSKFA